MRGFKRGSARELLLWSLINMARRDRMWAVSFVDNGIVNGLVSGMWLPSWRAMAYRAFGVELRKGATIHRNVMWHRPDKVAIGERSHVGSHCFLDGRGGITIEDDVNISQFCRLVTGTHDLSDPSYRSEYIFSGN